MKRVHLPDADTAYITLDGRELTAMPPIECDRTDCGYGEHYLLILEDELTVLIAAGTKAALGRLGLSGRAVS